MNIIFIVAQKNQKFTKIWTLENYQIYTMPDIWTITIKHKSTLYNSPLSLLNYAKNCNKSAILIFFSAIIELVRELVTCITNLGRIYENLSNYWLKMRKITINRPFCIFSAIIELVRELVISNMHNKFGRIHGKLFKLSRPQGQIIDVKCKKSQ